MLFAPIWGHLLIRQQSSGKELLFISLGSLANTQVQQPFPIMAQRTHGGGAALDACDGGGRKVKILCLHGYTQTADTFREKTGSLRKGLKSFAEFVYIDASFLAEPPSQDDVAASDGAANGRSWWTWTDEDGDTQRPSKAVRYKDVDTMLNQLQTALREHRPDGIIGFSQGATAAALLLAAVQQASGAPDGAEGSRGDDAPVMPRFAVLYSGFMPLDPDSRDLLCNNKIGVPLLCVYGEKDERVPQQKSFDLAACFEDTACFMHGGGHMVPTCSGEHKRQLMAFISNHGTMEANPK